MAERGLGQVSAPDEGLLRGAIAIVVVGLVLGVVFNWRGQESRPRWGLAWIGEDRLQAMPTLGDLANEGSVEAGSVQTDDPMAIPGMGGGDSLPAVPDLDRPIQVDLAAVEKFVGAGAALVVDARDRDEFAAGHIPGARNLPFDEAAGDPAMLEQLDAGGRAIIVYCGGGDCELSMSLGYELIFAGQRKVLVYMGGYPEWVAAGHPVETGEAGAKP